MKHALGIAATLAVAANILTAQEARKQDGYDLPLKPSRTVAFTTDEGTWMSLDVSPDGRTIVFDLLGDLYTMPIGGGKATRITSGMAWDEIGRASCRERG